MSGVQVYVATSTNPADECLTRFCLEMGVPCFQGSETNVLERYYQCATTHELDVIVRITSDCPLIDGELVRNALDIYIEKNDPSLYLSNYLERTFPRGFDFEIFSYPALEDAYLNASEPAYLEHVTPYINRNISGKISFFHITRQEDDSRYRITVDTPDDFRLLKEMIEKFQCDSMNAEEIIKILRDNPYLYDINSHVEQKSVD